MTPQRWIGILFAAALLVAAGCSGGGTTTSTGPVFNCFDSGSAVANAVTMSCGAMSATTERVDVMLGGPAVGSTSLSGLNFDVTYDPTKLHFVQAGSYASPLFPGALVAVALASGVEGRVIVSIQEPGTSPAINVGAGQWLVLSLTFQSVPGVNYPPTLIAFEHVEATGASQPITFGGPLTLSYQ